MKYLICSMFLFFLLISQVSNGQVYTVKTIPNQKLINGSYVSNPDAILSAGTVGEIDKMLRQLEDSTTIQVSVIAVRSIGEEDIADFAETLFNDWGIGRSGTDNGLMILLVVDKRTVHFHTGDGTEAILPDVLCKQIERDNMVPYFKEGDYDTGIKEGIKATTQILYNPDATAELKEAATPELDDWTAFKYVFLLFGGIIVFVIFLIKILIKKLTRKKKQSPYPEMKLTNLQWLLIYGILPVVIVLVFDITRPEDTLSVCLISLYTYLIFTFVLRQIRMKRVINRLTREREYFKVVEFLKGSQVYWFIVGIFFPLPFFLYFFYHLYRKKKYRNHPRPCHLCQGRMIKLDEKADDTYLTANQIFEEDLKSVDYDVWKCESCQATEKWVYKNSWSKYEACPKCETIAFYTKHTRTISAATYDSSGTGERTKECKFCHHIDVSTYSIPQLTRSSGSSSSSFSSSSSGGSWGGGSSSGGGASSSW